MHYLVLPAFAQAAFLSKGVTRQYSFAPNPPRKIMCRHQRFLALAAVEAEQSSETKKHGALLVRGGKVLGAGHNSARSRNTSVPGAANATSLHSEVAAVLSVPWVLPGSGLLPGSSLQ